MSPANEHELGCREVRTLLSEAIDDRLAQSEARALRAHLLRCVACRKSYDGHRRLAQLAGDLPRMPVSDDFLPVLIERIAAGEGTPPAVLEGPVPALLRFKLFASGAATAAALLLSLWLLVDGLSEGTGPGTALPVAGASRGTGEPGAVGNPVGSFNDVVEGFNRFRESVPRLVREDASEHALRRVRMQGLELRTEFDRLFEQMQRGVIIIPAPVDQDLRRADETLHQLMRANSLEDVLRIIRNIERCRISCKDMKLRLEPVEEGQASDEGHERNK